MQEVTVKTADLQERLQQNRANHRGQYEKAIAGWTKEVIQLLQDDIKALQGGAKRRLTVCDPMPHDHTADYDRVIEMLKMSIDIHQTIDEATFRQYVMDDWQWKQVWTASTAKYLSGG